MRELFCSICGEPVKVGEDARSVLCWRCTQRKVIQAERSQQLPLLLQKTSLEEILDLLSQGRISKLRKKLGLNQKQMAKLTGLNQQQYSRYERGILPNKKTMEKIEGFLQKAKKQDLTDKQSQVKSCIGI